MTAGQHTPGPRSFEQRLRDSGAIAFRGGLRRVDCVCAPGSAARRWWLLGYDAAKRAAKATGGQS